MGTIQDISGFLRRGRAENVKNLVRQALDEGEAPKEILDGGLLGGMAIIGEQFRNNEVFVPEVLVAARALNAGLEVLEPKLAEAENESTGKVVIGTVKGDLHDIGKNLVAMMLRGVGFEVTDLGVDVPPETFVDQAESVGADVICMSALLTTTMPAMEAATGMLLDRKIRDNYIVMIGGAPVNEKFAQQIGADYYTPDAATCAEVARDAVGARRQG